jgi:NADPH:quinone reductase-like Zn-dependent oxidoreductase
MKAIVQDRYGPPEVLRLAEVDRPQVGDDEVLVRVRATSVHPDVWHVVSGLPYVLRLMGAGVRRPKQRVPGTDLAGQVEAVGRNVTRFRPGDEVFGESIRGYQWRNGGTFAEYAAAPQEALAHKPERVTFAQAAAVPTAGLIVLQNLPDRTWLRPGRRVLVNGAGGGVGAIALQLCKAYGAEVTGVDHPAKLDMIRSLGADRVIDYTREDFTTGEERYDLIFDVPGNHPFARCRRVLAPDGKYVLIGHQRFDESGRRWLGLLPHFFRLMALSAVVRQLPRPTASMLDKQEGMASLREALERGELTPVVDRIFPLAQAAEAIRYLAAGGATGKVVLTG